MRRVEEFAMVPLQQWQWEQRQRERLSKMTPDEREALHEAEEAAAMREALSEENWGQA
jgi:hypothetical protein